MPILAIELDGKEHVENILIDYFEKINGRF